MGEAAGAGRTDATLGRRFFALYLFALGAVTFFIVPFTAFRATLREREEETWVLLALTGLGGRAIVRGKWLSAMSQGALFASACAPFVVFSYYLNGVDLPQIGAALALTLAWSALLAALGVGMATEARSRLGRTAATFGALAALGWASAMGLGFQAILAREGGRLLREQGFAELCLALFALSVGTTWLVLEASASGLALPTEVNAGAPRRVLIGLVGGGLLGAAVLFVVRGGTDAAAAAGVVLTCLYLVAVGVFAASASDGWARARPPERWLSRPGALRSFAVVTSLLVLAGVVWGALYVSTGRVRPDHTGLFLVSPAYPVLYLSLAVLIGRGTPLRGLGEPAATRVAFAGVTLAGSALPPILAGVLGRRQSDWMVNLFNPIVGMLHFIDGPRPPESAALVVVGAATLACFLAVLMLMTADGKRS